MLVDPILHTEPLASGCIEHSFTRALNLDRMPRPSAVVVTHAHVDHFDPRSLRQLPREVPIVAPRDNRLLAQLHAAGFSNV